MAIKITQPGGAKAAAHTSWLSGCNGESLYGWELWYKKLTCYFYNTGLVSGEECCTLFDVKRRTLNNWMGYFNIFTPHQKQKATGICLNKKRCSDCRQWLETNRFIKGGLRTFLNVRGVCKECRTKRRLRIRISAILYLGNKCKICEVKNLPVCCYDFHHRNPKEKEYEISRDLINRVPWEILKLELDKCDLLCSNCHRVIHRNSIRAKV